MRNAALFKIGRKFFRFFDGYGTHKNRLARGVATGDFIGHGAEFRIFRAINGVVLVLTDDFFVGGNFHDVDVVDFSEFRFFRHSGPGHAGELFVHTEEVLEGNRGQGFRFGPHFDAFLRFDGLVQAFGVAATVHETTGEFVDDDDFAVVHHVVDVFVHGSLRL